MEMFESIENSGLIIQSLSSEEPVNVAITAIVFIRYNWRVCGNNFRNSQEEHTWTIRYWGYQPCKQSKQDKASLGTVVWSNAI
jgi:hypothetical protein